MTTTMTRTYFCAAILFTLLMLMAYSPATIFARHITTFSLRGDEHQVAVVGNTKDGSNVGKERLFRGADTLQVAGSRLPDCSRACGSCSPCRLVMVSFVCSSLQEAETCPIAYKCMCHNKSYPVP
ncbi:protein EPIDERMAL PATTERNING FACTOR 1 [Arachis stenosperma]|uniref:protein EPIDERMAL PATTERNING FACTOR 1 n=1 Tax=Arachis stenosperma TaxID=217475 RepID=UPI0025ACFC55|nr:protein EPIDERMAL PATTERNING FACTOR 1 [Arachis stenosperma]